MCTTNNRPTQIGAFQSANGASCGCRDQTVASVTQFFYLCSVDVDLLRLTIPTWKHLETSATAMVLGVEHQIRLELLFRIQSSEGVGRNASHHYKFAPQVQWHVAAKKILRM